MLSRDGVFGSQLDWYPTHIVDPLPSYPDNPTLPSYNGPYTVMAWVEKPATAVTNWLNFGIGRLSTQYAVFVAGALNIAPTLKIVTDAGTTTVNLPWPFASGSPAAPSLLHLTVTCHIDQGSTTTAAAHYNGQQVGTAQNTGLFGTSSTSYNPLIGVNPNYGNGQYGGISNLKAWHRILTTPEIRAEMNSATVVYPHMCIGHKPLSDTWWSPLANNWSHREVTGRSDKNRSYYGYIASGDPSGVSPPFSIQAGSPALGKVMTPLQRLLRNAGPAILGAGAARIHRVLQSDFNRG